MKLKHTIRIGQLSGSVGDCVDAASEVRSTLVDRRKLLTESVKHIGSQIAERL